jgi:hypothetical protein
MALRWKILIAVLTLAFVFAAYSQAEVLEIWNCNPDARIGWVKMTDDGEDFTYGPVDVYGKAIIVYDHAEPGNYIVSCQEWKRGALPSAQEVTVEPGGKAVVKFYCREGEEF